MKTDNFKEIAVAILLYSSILFLFYSLISAN